MRNKLGNIFKTKDLDEDRNPRSLSEKMDLKFRRPKVYGDGAQARVTRDYIPTLSGTPGNPWPNYTHTCPIGLPQFTYAYRESIQFTDINVPVYVLFTQTVANFAFYEVYYNVSNSFYGAPSFSATLDPSFTQIIPSQAVVDASYSAIPSKTLISISNGQYLTIAIKLVTTTGWTAGTTKSLAIYNASAAVYDGINDMASYRLDPSFLGVICPSSCVF